MATALLALVHSCLRAKLALFGATALTPRVPHAPSHPAPPGIGFVSHVRSRRCRHSRPKLGSFRTFSLSRDPARLPGWPNWVCFARFPLQGTRRDWNRRRMENRNDGVHRQSEVRARRLTLQGPQIGFVSPRLFACPICRNSFSKKHLSFVSLQGKLASFRTLWPSRASMGDLAGFPPVRSKLALFRAIALAIRRFCVGRASPPDFFLPHVTRTMIFAGTSANWLCFARMLTTENEAEPCLPGRLRGFGLRPGTRPHVSSFRLSIINDKSSIINREGPLGPERPSTLGRRCTNRAEILRKTKAPNSRKLLWEKE